MRFLGSRPASSLAVYLPVIGSLCSEVSKPRDVGKALPNFDCLQHNLAEEVWESLERFLGSLTYFVVYGSVSVHGWLGQEAERQAWGRYSAVLFDHELSTTAHLSFSAECPMGLAVLDVARWGACLLAASQADNRCARHQVWFGAWMRAEPYGLKDSWKAIPVLLNSRWMAPLCKIVQVLRWVAPQYRDVLDPQGHVRARYDCTLASRERKEGSSGVDWQAYLETLASSSNRFAGENTTFRWVFMQGGLSGGFGTKVTECTLGYMSAAIERLNLFQQFIPEHYEAVSFIVDAALISFNQDVALFLTSKAQQGVDIQVRDSFTVLVLTQWPVLQLLSEIGLLAQSRDSWTRDAPVGAQHKPFALDLRPEELLDPIREPQWHPNALRALPYATHAALLRSSRWGWSSQAFRALLLALEAVLVRTGAHDDRFGKVVILTVVWGERLAKYLPGWLERASALGHGGRTLVFCLSTAAARECAAAHKHPELCVEGGLRTVYNKLALISVVVHAGLDAVFFDFDTVFLKDPLPLIIEAARDAEVLVSRDFGSECLNIGVLYAKAHEDSAEFFSGLLIWLWYHPYEFDQNALMGFLGLRNLTQEQVFGRQVVKIPRWGILDPVNAFITNIVYKSGTEGWTGELEGIAVYHFLDGSGNVHPSLSARGSYLNLFQFFLLKP